MANCTACGHPLAADDRFCGECGAAVTAAPSAPAPPPSQGAVPPPPPSIPAPPPTMAPPPAVPPTMGAATTAAAAVPWFKTVPGILGLAMIVAAAAVVTVVLVTRGDDGGATAGGTVTTLGASSTTAAGPTTTGAGPTTTAGPATTAAPTTTTEAVTTTTSGYDSAYRDAFFDSCTEGTNRPFCRCVYNEFRAAYPADQLTAILDGSAPVPDDFTNYSAACFNELPIKAPLPDFALPNTCALDSWPMVVRYPSGWEVDEAFGECLTYRPAGDDPETYPIMVGVDDLTTLDGVVAAYGDPAFTYDFGDRVVYGYLSDAPGGGLWVDYYTPLWSDLLDGPVVYVLTNDTTVPDVIRYADMILKGLEIEPYTP
ncbi:MAG: zinc ribbon domain-containing protein [Actinobacteria bacterium]|nr:zinc ribbon domain-containing protein [Actinomycetota bacterium]